MKKLLLIFGVLFLLFGCANKVEYLNIDKTYVLEDGRRINVYRTRHESIYVLE